MKKYIVDLKVKQVEWLNEKYALIRLTHSETLPEMIPGQFVEVRADHTASTFLRSPLTTAFTFPLTGDTKRISG